MNQNERDLNEYTYKKVPLEDNVRDNPNLPEKYGYGVRHVQAALLFLCLTVGYIARAHMGVTIVAMTAKYKENKIMVNMTAINLANNDTVYFNDTGSDVAFYQRDNISELFIEENLHHTFNWSKPTQEIVLGSFYLGYCIMMFPIGFLCQRFGGKVLLQTSLFIEGIFAIGTPWMTYWGDWKAASVCRFVQGLNQAGLYPCIQTVLAKWAPVSELGTLTSYVYTGTPIGNVVAFQLGGLLADSRWGWPSTYWAVGAINIISLVLLTVFGSESPHNHSKIKEKEKNFILGTTNAEKPQRPKIPWKAILTSVPLWGTIATHIGSGVTFVFFFTEVPLYIYYILGKDVKSSGLLTSLPYVGAIFSSIVFGWISDYATNNNIVSIKNARRISNTISQFGIALLLICVSYTDNIILAVTYLVLAMSADMGCHTGWMVNHIDLAPNFSGLLMTIGNVFMNIFIVLLPVVVSFVVTDVTDIIQWRIMFYIVASVSMIANIIFVVLMSADVQPWNYVDNNNTTVHDVIQNKIVKKNNTHDECTNDVTRL